MADESEEGRKKTHRNSSLEKKRGRSKNLSGDEEKKTKSNKRKSRKRSYSDSNPSSTSSRDSEKVLEKKVEKKKKKKRSPSSVSESSSSDSNDKHTSRTKLKKKKLKKEKKAKKKKKKEKKGNQQGALDQNKYGKYGIIRESDLFVKQQEFYCWLLEVKNTNPETLPKFEARKMFDDFMEDYNTATLPHKKYYDLEKWENKKQQKSEVKALKKARDSSFSIVDDEKRHDMLHRTVSNKYAGPSRQQLLEMQQELRRRQDEEYRKRAGLS